jgi:hypothetical protein
MTLTRNFPNAPQNCRAIPWPVGVSKFVNKRPLNGLNQVCRPHGDTPVRYSRVTANIARTAQIHCHVPNAKQATHPIVRNRRPIRRISILVLFISPTVPVPQILIPLPFSCPRSFHAHYITKFPEYPVFPSDPARAATQSFNLMRPSSDSKVSDCSPPALN